MAAWVRRIGNLVCAAGVALMVLLVLGVGYGPLPALGPALVPGGGVWESAAADRTAHDETLRLSGLTRSATVRFTPEGYATIDAATDRDLFFVQGYVTARFRIAQMDLARRLGRGRLAELNGPSQLATDKLELQLGLLRSAEAEWAATRKGSPAHQALVAYADGVNAWLKRLGHTGEWPPLYALTGVRPGPWTPVDSLVVQKVFTQQMDFSAAPLTYELLRGSLGPELAARWFPEQAVTRQQPYDPGPYRTLPLVPISAPNANAAAATAPTSSSPASPSPSPSLSVSSTVRAAGSLLTRLRESPYGGGRERLNSNAWAVNGPAVAHGRSMLAGDPHIQLVLPSSWFQVTLRSPGYRVSGGSLPGLPSVVIGRNEHISWSLTNASNQATFYYKERTSADRPGFYYWKGAWRRMEKVRYTIQVRGAKPVPLEVDLTVHGPVLTMKGQTLSVTWLGNYRSTDLSAMLGINRARNHAEFRAAVRGWGAPAMNIVYADDDGNIAAITPGYFPQFPKGTEPWRPMSGTGSEEITGTIPFDALPQIHNPPEHIISSTNQRPVGDDYPYYIGISMNFGPGYRQSVILDRRRERGALTPADSATLQNDVTDDLARRLVPALLKVLERAELSDRERAGRDLLARWNYTMDADSAAASVWWTFFTNYFLDVFQPWWNAKKVPVRQDQRGLELKHFPIPLLEALERWTLNDPDNAAFSPPGEARRDAPAVMRMAYGRAINELTDRLGPAPAMWAWGRLHSREIPSITGVPSLGYGPYPDGGDQWTVNAAGGDLPASFGPSWRTVIHWAGPKRASATAIYPGGQSENPASPWYDNLIVPWRDGRALPLPLASPPSGGVSWTVRPGS